jgi:hypothetical protein
LEKPQFATALLQVLAQGLGCFGIILCSQGLKGEGHLKTKGHRSPEDTEPICCFIVLSIRPFEDTLLMSTDRS